MIEHNLIIANPSKYFETPSGLYHASELSIDEKIHALGNWINEEKQLIEASNENMLGIGEEDEKVDMTLNELNQLLDQLMPRH